MRSTSSPLLPILKSTLQGDLLALLYLNPDETFSLTDIARATESNVKTVHVEANRLVASGFAKERRAGNTRLLGSPDPSPVVNALRDLLVVSYGPVPVLTNLLRQVNGVEEAFIYGSWAARHGGAVGPIPHDVDVAVIGSADLDDLDSVGREAQALLRKHVDIRRLSHTAWTDLNSDNPFVLSLRERPRAYLPLGGIDADVE